MGVADEDAHCRPNVSAHNCIRIDPTGGPRPWFVDEVSSLEIFALGDVAGHGLLAPGMEVQVKTSPDCTCATVMYGFQAKGIMVPRHWHLQQQVFIVETGLLVIEQYSKPFVYRAGEVATIPPRVPHTVYSAEDTSMYMTFSPYMPIRWEPLPEDWSMNGAE